MTLTIKNTEYSCKETENYNYKEIHSEKDFNTTIILDGDGTEGEIIYF